MRRTHGLARRGVCAHRGGASHRPENTLAAFRHAGDTGVHQVEFDVRRSADGELVVIHDAAIDRTTSGTGLVCDWKLADLRRLDAGSWWDGDFAQERIPTLEEALEALPGDVWINVQIKRGERVVREVVRTVLDAGRGGQVILTCGNRDAEAAKALDPDLRVCNLARQRTRSAYVDHAIASGADVIQFHHLRGPMEPALAARAHAAGLLVNYFCEPKSTAAGLHALFAAGVDFVLVDDLELGLAAARQVGIEPLARSRAAAVRRSGLRPTASPL